MRALPGMQTRDQVEKDKGSAQHTKSVWRKKQQAYYHADEILSEVNLILILRVKVFEYGCR